MIVVPASSPASTIQSHFTLPPGGSEPKRRGGSSSHRRRTGNVRSTAFRRKTEGTRLGNRLCFSSRRELKVKRAAPSPGLRARLSGRNKFGSRRESEVRGVGRNCITALLLFFTLIGCHRAPNINNLGGTKLIFKLNGPLQSPPDAAAENLRKRLDPSKIFGVEVTINEPSLEISFPSQTDKDLFIPNLQFALARGNTLEIRTVASKSDTEIAAAIANADPASPTLTIDGKVVGHWRPIAVDANNKPRSVVTPTSFSRQQNGKTELLLKTSDSDILSEHVEFANKVFDERDMPAIAFKLTPAGAKQMQVLSKTNIGREIGIVIGGEIVAAPRMMAAMSDRGQITGNYTDQEATVLVSVLRLGSLPFKVVDEPPQVVVVPKAGG